MRVPGIPSPYIFALFVTGLMVASFVPLEVTNLAFKNFSSKVFSADEHSVLGLSLGFAPAIPFDTEATATHVHAAHTRMMRGLYLSDYFSEEPPGNVAPEQPSFSDDNPPPRFRVPRPEWHPLQEDDYSPAPGIHAYGEETLSDMLAVIRALPRGSAAITRNLPGRLRAALQRLKADKSIVILDTDKNLGLVADDTVSYIQHCEDELARTHTRLTESAEYILRRTLSRMKTAIEPFLSTLPKWAAKFLKKTFKGFDPCTGKPFRIPSYRVLYKIHKAQLQFRPITGNHCWCTQPLAALLAFLLRPFIVNNISTHVPDTDSFQRGLLSLLVNLSSFIVTYDVERLYPSIPHEAAVRCLRTFLTRAGCAFVEFAVTALEFILGNNFCIFGGVMRQQFIGFATGVACACEAADIYLDVTLMPFFARHVPPLTQHKRYIDDGCLPNWTGSYASVAACFGDINANNPDDLVLTYEISERGPVVFLDLLLIKDDAWRHTGLISTACYQKPVNRYLYLPFLTEMPRHVLEGFIRGEIIRYVKRCSAITPFLEMLRLFWTRLSVRGYPAHFLFETFRSAADYTQRAALLAKPAHSAADSTRSQVLILTFSRSLHQAQLGRILHEHRYLLPAKLQELKVILAWRAPRKLGGMLIPFRSDSPLIDDDTPLASAAVTQT